MVSVKPIHFQKNKKYIYQLLYIRDTYESGTPKIVEFYSGTSLGAKLWGGGGKTVFVGTVVDTNRKC